MLALSQAAMGRAITADMPQSLGKVQVRRQSCFGRMHLLIASSLRPLRGQQAGGSEVYRPRKLSELSQADRLLIAQFNLQSSQPLLPCQPSNLLLTSLHIESETFQRSKLLQGYQHSLPGLAAYQGSLVFITPCRILYF